MREADVEYEISQSGLLNEVPEPLQWDLHISYGYSPSPHQIEVTTRFSDCVRQPEIFWIDISYRFKFGFHEGLTVPEIDYFIQAAVHFSAALATEKSVSLFGKQVYFQVPPPILSARIQLLK